jgi:hypothetical protein
MIFNEYAKTSLERINFQSRYFNIISKHPFREAEGEKLQKSQVLPMLKEIGYNFKFTEQSYVCKDIIDPTNEFQITLNIKYGCVTPYFIVKINNEYINMNSGNLGFVYQYFEGGSSIKLPWYSTLFELKEIASEIMELYDDFKKEMGDLKSK